MGAEIVTNLTRNLTSLGQKGRKRGFLIARNVTTFLAVVTILGGCQTAGGTFCAISKPIRLSQQSVAALSDAEVAQVLAFNKRGERLCGWKP